MSTLPYQQPGIPSRRPGLVPRARRSGSAAFGYRLNRIQRNILDGPWRSFGIIISNSLGVAISIAIIAAAEGIQTKINDILSQCPPGSQCAQVVDVATIQQVLDQTKAY